MPPYPPDRSFPAAAQDRLSFPMSPGLVIDRRRQLPGFLYRRSGNLTPYDKAKPATPGDDGAGFAHEASPPSLTISALRHIIPEAKTEPGTGCG